MKTRGRVNTGRVNTGGFIRKEEAQTALRLVKTLKASERRVIVVDGFITTAAALAACELAPNARPYCVFAHHSQERGHTLMLERLHAQALLDLGLRLGEGTGAMLAWPLLQSACAILNEMATFESAQVSNRA